MASPPASSSTLEGRIELPWVQKLSLSEAAIASATAPSPKRDVELGLATLAVRTPSRSGCNAVDRKSTRLNSSHSQISYAVFCLKKKKKTSTTCTSTYL